HQQTRCYIGDEEAARPACYNSLARGHWEMENHLHWHLDVTFKEDACRAGVGNAPLNLSTMRKFALQLLSNMKDKHSLKKRQYKAALDMEYMKKILNF
ncbi:hypothetical protein EZS27_034634, partial [termite gut metagenome]